jgi:hypothetical protein
MTCGGICMRDFAEISSKLALAHTERRSALADIYTLRLFPMRLDSQLSAISFWA